MGRRPKQVLFLLSDFILFILFYYYLILKWTEDLNRSLFFPRKYTDGQQTHEKIFNTANYQGSANQNHHEISPYTC